MALKRTLSLVLMVLLVGSLFLICFCMSKAESATKPSVPQFTLQYLERSGYTSAIEITIKNQPIAAVNKSNDYFYNIYYNLQYKWHSAESWTSLHYITNWTNQLVTQSDSKNTVISLPIFSLGDPIGNQVDIQVEAYIATGIRYTGSIGFWNWTESGWSGTHTLTVPASGLVTPAPTTLPSVIQNSATPTTVPTQSSGNPLSFQLDWLGVVAVATLGLVTALLVVVVVLSRRIRRLERKVAS
jgi:hypothetical protein